MLEKLRERGGKATAGIRSPELAERIKEEPADADVTDRAGQLDPRAVFDELDRVIPKD